MKLARYRGGVLIRKRLWGFGPWLYFYPVFDKWRLRPGLAATLGSYQEAEDLAASLTVREID
jgi:hypothetical protein